MINALTKLPMFPILFGKKTQKKQKYDNSNNGMGINFFSREILLVNISSSDVVVDSSSVFIFLIAYLNIQEKRKNV